MIRIWKSLYWSRLRPIDRNTTALSDNDRPIQVRPGAAAVGPIARSSKERQGSARGDAVWIDVR
jgi:hypothetical protein